MTASKSIGVRILRWGRMAEGRESFDRLHALARVRHDAASSMRSLNDPTKSIEVASFVGGVSARLRQGCGEVSPWFAAHVGANEGGQISPITQIA
jgi:hypothetical protein